MLAVSLEKAVDFTSPEVLGGYVATAIVAVVGLLLTVLVLKRVLYKPLQKMMADRQEEIEGAVRDNQEEARALKDRQEALEAREADQRETLARTREEAEAAFEKQAEAILQAARLQAGDIVAGAERQAEEKRQKADDLLYRQAVDLAIDALSRLHDRSPRPDEEAWVETSIRRELDSKEEGLES